MTKTHFENLKVYQLSEKLSDEIWALIRSWPAFDKNTIGSQIVRSADSIGANLAEGSGRGSDADYKRFIRMSRGSLYETRHWLRRAFRRGLLTQDHIECLTPINEELTPSLNAFLKSIGTFRREHEPVAKDQKPKARNQKPAYVAA